jgi:hypothetical protein
VCKYVWVVAEFKDEENHLWKLENQELLLYPIQGEGGFYEKRYSVVSGFVLQSPGLGFPSVK